MSQKYFDPEGLARVGHMELVARQVVEGFLTGRHRSPYHGFSVEYLDHRAVHARRRPARHRLEDPRPHRQVPRQAVRGRDEPPRPHPHRLLQVDGLQERRAEQARLRQLPRRRPVVPDAPPERRRRPGAVRLRSATIPAAQGAKDAVPPHPRPARPLLQQGGHRRRRRAARRGRAHPAPRAGHPSERPDRRRGQDRQRPAALPPQQP